MNWIEANPTATAPREGDSMATSGIETGSALTTAGAGEAPAASDADISVGDIYEQIADRLAEARTRALMGERDVALGMLQAASLEYRRFREILVGYPGYHALEYAFTVTMTQLCAEQERFEQTACNLADAETEQPDARRGARRKAGRAA